MKTIWSDTIDNILNVGEPLENFGVYNWALTKSQAINVLNQFLDLQISVLGGDVYENDNGLFRSNYDSWYCNKLKGEEKNAFLKRSIEKAKNYIEEYKSQNIDNIFFVFVPF